MRWVGSQFTADEARRILEEWRALHGVPYRLRVLPANTAESHATSRG